MKASKKTATRSNTAKKQSPPKDSTSTLNNKLKADIVQRLSLSGEPEVRVPEPKAIDLILIATMLASAKQKEVGDPEFDLALQYWEKSHLFLQRKKDEERRRRAVQELLFKKGEPKLTKADFLQKLLPKDEVAKREEILKSALQSIRDKFGQCFKIGGTGWPESNLSILIEAQPSASAIVIADHYLNRINEAVDLDLACMVAPYVLAWRDLISSPKARGSKGRTTRQASEVAKSHDTIEPTDG